MYLPDRGLFATVPIDFILYDLIAVKCETINEQSRFTLTRVREFYYIICKSVKKQEVIHMYYRSMKSIMKNLQTLEHA